MNRLAIRILLALAALISGFPSAPAAEQPVNSASMAPPAPARAVKPSAPARQATGYYVAGKERVFTSFPAAPKPDSDRDHTDLLITLVVQGSRNSSQIEESKNDAKYGDAIKAMDHLVDPAFETAHPGASKVAQLLQHADEDGAMIMHKLKNQNARLRPFRQHPGLVVPVVTAEDFSYPSGHASGAELQARILAALFPDHAAEVMNKAKVIAESRVVAGVHYESDVEAGRNLGDLIFSTLQANAKFARDLEAAKRELAGK